MEKKLTNTNFDHEINKVLIIGLGQLGLPVAKYVKEKTDFDTYGFDIKEEAMERAEKIALIKKVEDNTDLGEFDVFILCVSTHKVDDIFTPQIEGLLSIIKDKIAKEAKNGALVSIESTIPRGTSKKVFELLGHRLHVVHVPHRWYALEEGEHGVDQLRVVGGVCDCCLNAAMRFYSGVAGHTNNTNKDNLGIPLFPVSNIEIAEITKIAENAHRYLQIAFAEDLYLYCQANNLRFADLREAINTKWNVNVLEPRDGIGGHCLPKDTMMFLHSSKSPIKSKILTAAIEVDRDYRKYKQARSIAARSIAAQETEQSVSLT
ncbi:MAG: NAD(P)-binding domain-containing protein [Nitrososphaeraceae archaeon]